MEKKRGEEQEERRKENERERKLLQADIES